MKKIAFITVVVLQIMIVITFYHEIQRKLDTVLGISTNVIDSHKIRHNIDNKPEYFYEPVPNSIDIETVHFGSQKISYIRLTCI